MTEKPTDIAFSLVDQVRNCSDLPWSECQGVALQVLSHLVDRNLTADDLESIRSCLASDVLQVDDCADMQRLRQATERLGSMFADTQERSWALHEETDQVTEFLEYLEGLVSRSDPRVPRKVFNSGDGPPLEHVVQLYQMEQRNAVRVALLKLLNSIVRLSPEICDSLSTYTLPRDLARDLTGGGGKNTEVGTKFFQSKETESLKLLAAIFGTGSPVTFQNRDMIYDAHLLRFVTTKGDLGLNVLLALNLQYSPGEENPVVKACSKGVSEHPGLIQEVISILNHGKDPVWVFSGTRDLAKCPDPALKLAIDIVDSSSPENPLFYSNDLTVLYDVCVRHIANLPLSPRRTQFLKLLLSLMKFLSSEQKEEIQYLMGTTECNPADVEIVHDIVAACENK